ncbi:UDP-N-acetylmuramate--L-alanine ligase [Gleimia coleocanis DSM 15436]|uniref:UDP-N-acetylmuramate--L-alanine ligase n=1 Tax=Gleimia coleocanis DSM 15436 TaxID=525245 RepID=C0VZB3_9ACTO|nr:UDP-N-acetylmuramate--L-alanine ligase [Gleimia coleocanis]EEH64214.1 UDP-N-acetylmuramate--L-alanine ligase [Gleimia coleocanis DSM 15436]
MTEIFHLIGVGGAGMSVVAELLLSRGFKVSGSDQADSAGLQRLRSLGIEAFVGHDAGQVPVDATVVVSTAVRETNPELAFAREHNLPVIHRSQALAIAAQGLDFVAVAGAHGKTTTSGMLAAALSAAGMDPSFAVGGVVAGFGTGAHLGQGRFFVAEADESDGSFLNYTPRVALVTNVEPDHLDHYGSREAFEAVFDEFVTRITADGALVVCADDPGASALGQRVLATGRRVWSYGLDSSVEGAQHLQISEVELHASGSSFLVSYGDETVAVHLNVSGLHNVLNATGALAVALDLGISLSVMAEALKAFTGTGRRFEFKGEVAGKRLFDDYAHHPSEVAAALKQARVVVGEGKVVVLFQPHLYSRTRNFAAEFAASLALADQVVLADIYGAREDPMPGITSALIGDKLVEVAFVGPLETAAEVAAELTEAGDICITMGAGNVTSVGNQIINYWQN